MRPKEFAALVALLEDPDQEVYRTISDKLVNEGLALVPLLEKAWENTTSEVIQKRVEDILGRVQFVSTQNNLSGWIERGCSNLLEGALYIAKYEYPDIEYEVVDNHINKIKKKVWHELNESLTPLEKVKVLNHIIFGVLGFSGNTANFFSPHNHFINHLIEKKKGGPVLLSLFYSIIAQRLGLPIFPVSLPRNFLVAYKDRYLPVDPDNSQAQNILFYINPFNQGAVLGRTEIEQFLTQNKIPAKEEYFTPCSNRTTVSQLITSLITSYQKTDNNSKIEDLRVFLKMLYD